VKRLMPGNKTRKTSMEVEVQEPLLATEPGTDSGDADDNDNDCSFLLFGHHLIFALF
jgi:hypothetical protein